MTLVYKRSVIRHSIPEIIKMEKISNRDINEVIEELIKSSKKLPTQNPEKSDIDLVYIVRPGERNIDLRYSLRSVSKFCKYRNIWIVGFKPYWVQNVKFIPTQQTGDKWKNSMVNYTAACKSREISDNFVLMNDDFFAIRPVNDWNHDCNVCLGELEDFVRRFSTIENRSKWQYGFEYAVNLLNSIRCNRHINYEIHTPIILNKQNFLAMLGQKEIIDFMSTKKVFHKRSIYKNLYPDIGEPRVIEDVKLNLYKDVDLIHLQENWISTYDNTLDNSAYPLINKLIKSMFNKRCKYEKDF